MLGETQPLRWNSPPLADSKASPAELVAVVAALDAAMNARSISALTASAWKAGNFAARRIRPAVENAVLMICRVSPFARWHPEGTWVRDALSYFERRWSAV